MHICIHICICMLHMGHWLFIVARATGISGCHFSCPFWLAYVEFSLPSASSMAPRARICGLRMSGPSSLFLFAVSVVALSDLRDNVIYWKETKRKINNDLQCN